MSKATRFNRQVMAGMGFFAVILLACVYGMLYFSFQNVEDKHVISNLYSIRFGQGMNDSLSVMLNDSLLFQGTASDTLFLCGDGLPTQNMISVEDHTADETLNFSLPVEPTLVVISRDGRLNIETMKMMAPVN